MHIRLLLWSDGVYLVVTQTIKTSYSGLLLTVSIQYRISWGYHILFVNSNSLTFVSTVYDKLKNGLSSDSVGMLPLHMKCITAPPTTLQSATQPDFDTAQKRRQTAFDSPKYTPPVLTGFNESSIDSTWLREPPVVPESILIPVSVMLHSLNLSLHWQALLRRQSQIV